MLIDISSKDTIFLDLDIKSKEELFEMISKRAINLKLVEDKISIIEDFIEREKRTETYLGSNCAIPHVKSDKVLKNSIFFVRLNKELTWSGNDKVKCIFLILVKNIDIQEHLKILKMVSSIVLKNEILKVFKNSNNKKEISNIINEKMEL